MARSGLSRAHPLHGLDPRVLRGLRHLQLHEIPAEPSQHGDGSAGQFGLQATSQPFLPLLLPSSLEYGNGIPAQLQAWHIAVHGGQASGFSNLGVSRIII